MLRLAALAVVASVTACLPVQSRSAMPVAAPRSSGDAPFEVELVAADAPVAAAAPSGTLTITFREETRFEYQLTIRDESGETWSTVWVARRGTGEVMAWLLTDLSLRGAYSQVRGTASAAGPAGQGLRELFATYEEDLEIRVGSASSASGQLRGVVRRGRQ